ncbi:MAG: hypothetical protein JWN00_1773 [Actinomycetia bacterium]|nr:hypothetical protein [Actinomycetes bacterium]
MNRGRNLAATAGAWSARHRWQAPQVSHEAAPEPIPDRPILTRT